MNSLESDLESISFSRIDPNESVFEASASGRASILLNSH